MMTGRQNEFYGFGLRVGALMPNMGTTLLLGISLRRVDIYRLRRFIGEGKLFEYSKYLGLVCYG